MAHRNLVATGNDLVEQTSNVIASNVTHAQEPRPAMVRKEPRRPIFKMNQVFRILNTMLLAGTIVVLFSFSRYMERSLPRELLVKEASMRLRQRTFPRIMLCRLDDRNHSAPAAISGHLQCQPILYSVASLRETQYEHPEESLYPIKPPRTVSSLASEHDPTRFYSDSKERRLYPKHEYDPHCEPIDPSWQSTLYPVCNNIHAHSMVEELLDQSLSVLSSKGFWRLAWKQQENLVGSVGSIHVTVWKTLKIEHNFDEAYYEYNRVDAVAMETLTASRNIIDIYAICGTSVVTEFAGKNFETLVNRLDSIQRLKMAIQVAQGVADVHGITSNMPSLVHNDLNPANLVLTQDNRAVLNDFNIAVLLMKHNETNEPCPFLSRFPNPRWRAPEEQVVSEDESTHNPPRGTEKVDIYALGNIFYRLAIGSTPWKVPHTHKVTPKQKAIIVHLKRSTGALPPIPHCIEEYPDPAVQVLLEAMRRAYRHQPANRPSAKSLVQFLTSSLKEIRAMNLTGHELLWDGVRSSRKRNVAMLSVNSTEHVAQLFIGNANCSVDSTGKPTSLKTLMKY